MLLLLLLLSLCCLMQFCIGHGSSYGSNDDGTQIFTPFRVSYDQLFMNQQSQRFYIDDDDSPLLMMIDALTTTGMISITDLPVSAKNSYRTMVQLQQSCIEQSTKKHIQEYRSTTTTSNTDIDESIIIQRQTIAVQSIQQQQLATESLPLSPIIYNSDDETKTTIPGTDDPCHRFDVAATTFRTTTHDVIQAFTKHLSNYVSFILRMNKDDVNDVENYLLLSSRNVNDVSHATTTSKVLGYKTVVDIVQNGILLEHFHSYRAITSNSTSNSTINSKNTPKMTIPLHIDQGLFLSFTPGRYSVTGEMACSGLYIQLSDGVTQEVQFDNEIDQLVIMLGDGINQYINPKIVAATGNSAKQLYAVPHAIHFHDEFYARSSTMSASGSSRIWYGVMILPPPTALHPKYNISFQELRDGLIHGSSDSDNYLQLACSSTDSIQLDLGMGSVNHRYLQEECNNVDEIYCWHKCMNITQYNISAEICDHTFQLVQCINPRDELWNGINHGDYYPGCAESDAPNETAIPTLPGYPRSNDEECTNNFADPNLFADANYPNSMMLNDGDGAIFQFSISNDNSNVMKGRLIFNGIFGYVAIGFAGADGSINKMHNGRVIVAKRGDNYSPRFGLDLSLPPSIDEYIIDESETTFRIWGEQSYNDGTTANYRVVSDECFTTLTFETNQFADQPFNIRNGEGSDTFIWAANNMDAYMQYHGNNRGVFFIDYTSIIIGSGSTASTSNGVSTSAFWHQRLPLLSVATTAMLISSMVW